ncbi:MAG: hypothetical protein HKN32_02315 [Flavobacteriales bacterium]|nr:hypothetical protein [Flavobacteriales bacterium]
MNLHRTIHVALALFTLLLGAQDLSAQLNQRKAHHVMHTNGELEYANSVVYEHRIMREGMFHLDSSVIRSQEIRFFKNNNGYFANLEYAYESRPNTYAMRIRKGSVDLYEEIDINVYGGEELGAGDLNIHPSKLATGRAFQYYCIDGQHIRKASYRNLAKDLRAFPEGLENLRKHRKYQVLQVSLIAASASMIVGGLAANHEDPAFTPVMGLGVVFGGLSLFCNTPKQDYLWNAVEVYRRFR